jgi:hypothetical protein
VLQAFKLYLNVCVKGKAVCVPGYIKCLVCFTTSVSKVGAVETYVFRDLRCTYFIKTLIVHTYKMNKQHKREIAAEHTDKCDINEDQKEYFLSNRGCDGKLKYLVCRNLFPN